MAAEVERALKVLGAEGDLAIPIEYARDEQFGDYACTVAMDKRVRESCALARPEFKNPKVFASAIGEQLESCGLFERVEVAGPGFLNLTLAANVLSETLAEARLARDHYGESQVARPRRILFEFVSANPTGPLNVVSARAAALGDSCSNLLSAVGENVHREFYVNDFGNQVDLLGHSVLLRYFERCGVPLKFAEKDGDSYQYPSGPGLPFPAGGYHGEYLMRAVDAIVQNRAEDLPSAARLEQARLDAASGDASDPYVQPGPLSEVASTLGRAATDYFLDTQKADLARFRVEFDEFFRESTLHDSGAVMAASQKLKDSVFEEAGRLLFRSTAFGDDKDRVIVREDGRPTYLLADIAYHESKISRGYTHIYNIWGPDHHGYIARLAGAMQALGFPADQFRVLIAQQVNLLDGGQQVRMSKRAGRVITMSELLDEIPTDVVRYFFVMRSFESHLDFDLSEARDTSEKNPYYYVAYAHARIRSIFSRASERGLLPAEPESAVSKLELTPERRRLLWLVARFPEEVYDAARSLEPHRLVNYLYALATALSRFYGPRENRIIEQDGPTAGALLAILEGVALCLKNGLALLGMEAPERMVREDEPEA